jgi:hypothetical protein
LALASCELAEPQIPLTLDPALMNIEADAKATNAISNVYSIRSWPDSSRQNRWMKVRITFHFSFSVKSANYSPDG